MIIMPPEISIIIPARNEEGNIEKVVESLPKLGKKSEIIFVEGGSKDNSWEEIKRVSEKYKNIKYRSLLSHFSLSLIV